MNVKRLSTRIGSLVAAVMLFTTVNASAQSTFIQSTNFTNLSDPINQSITFNQFNPNNIDGLGAQGTLQSVTLTISNVFVNGTASLKNTGGSAHSYTIALNGDYSLTDTLGNLAETTVLSPSQTTASPLAPGLTFTTTPTTNTVAGSSTITSSSVPTLTLYTGTGTTTSFLTLTSFSGVTVFSGPTPYAADAASTGSGAVTLTYTYAPVPEPATTAAWMLGFAVCLLFGRRFFRRTAIKAD